MLDRLKIPLYNSRWQNQLLISVLRFLIAGGTLFLVGFLPSRIATGSRLPILLLVLIIGAFIGRIFLLHPNLGFYALILGSFLGNFGVGTGTATSINSAVIILGMLIAMWLLDLVVRQQRIHFSQTTIPLMIFMVMSIISFAFGQLNWFYTNGASLFAQLSGLAIFLLSAFACLLVANRINLDGLMKMSWIFLVCGGSYILMRLIPGLSSIAGRLVTGDATGSLFWIWFVAIAFSQALFNRKMEMYWRVILALFTFLTFYLGLGLNRFWTSGWLPSLVAVLVIIWVGIPRLRIPMLVFGFFLIVFSYQKIIGFVMVGDNNTFTLSARSDAWSIVLEIAKANPIFGVGFANYHWYASLFPIMGYWVPLNSHNNYIDLIAQTGIVGTVSFLWVMGSIGILGWRLIPIVPDGFPKAFIYGAIGGLVGMLVAGMLGDWVLPFVYNVGLGGVRSSILGWIFLGGLLMLEAKYKRKVFF